MKKVSEPIIAYKSIKNWREDERPREKIKMHGTRSLSDAELLAIVLREGTRNLSAIEVAKSLLDKFFDFNTLAAADFAQFKDIKGIGEAKAILLSAVFEVAKRVQAEPFPLKKKILTAKDVANYYVPKLKNSMQEVLIVLMLNANQQMIRDEVITKGVLNSTLAHPREIFRLAIVENAASIILIHNHPSGNPEPSQEDMDLTQQIEKAGELIDIQLRDHIIIAGDRYYSFVGHSKILPKI